MAKAKKERITLTQGEEPIDINYDNLRNAVLVLRAVNHDLRRQIIELLSVEERMTVTELYIKLRIEQSVASQHLAILRKAGLVIPSREGKYIRYQLNRERLKQILQLVSDIAEEE